MNEKLRAAAQAARDAMRMAQRSHGEILLTYPPLDSWVHHRVDLRLNDAIKAVEDALAEPAIKESLTVAEPVAWMSDSDVGFYKEEFGMYPCVPLYTAPPRREWVGLTKEEVDSCLEEHGWLHDAYYPVIKDIETRLREKNT